MIDIIGVFYELPDGSIVKTTGWDGRHPERELVSFYREGGDGESILKSKTEGWKQRPDLKDFPNAKNPRLPYVFDLFWDIKYTSEIIALFNGELWWLDNDILEIVEKLKENSLAFLIPEKYCGDVVTEIFDVE